MADTKPYENKEFMYSSSVSVWGKEFKRGKRCVSVGVLGDVFSCFIIIASSITPPCYKSHEVALDTLAVAVPDRKAVTQNYVITLGFEKD